MAGIIRSRFPYSATGGYCLFAAPILKLQYALGLGLCFCMDLRVAKSKPLTDGEASNFAATEARVDLIRVVLYPVVVRTRTEIYTVGDF